MKKSKSIIILLVAVFALMTTHVNAADEYTFNLEYEGEITVNEEKDATVTLTGQNGTSYTNALIKVEIEGPAVPKLIATDSTGVKHDIAELGYWGPVSGFPVQGDFVNRTPIQATFTKAGNYTIKISLVDVSNSNAVIATNSFQIHVNDVDQGASNTVENTVTPPPEEITEIPQTGMSFGEIFICIIAIAALIVITYTIYKKQYGNKK